MVTHDNVLMFLTFCKKAADDGSYEPKHAAHRFMALKCCV